jgi:hypothetical protein
MIQTQPSPSFTFQSFNSGHVLLVTFLLSLSPFAFTFGFLSIHVGSSFSKLIGFGILFHVPPQAVALLFTLQFLK